MVASLSKRGRGRPHREKPDDHIASPLRRCSRSRRQSILALRRERRLGVKQLRNELIRQHQIVLSLDTLHRVLLRHNEQVLKRPRRWRKGERRYSRPIPGERVQMDVCKIRPGIYQYTALDDCSRYKVLRLYDRASASSTLDFLNHVVEDVRHSQFNASRPTVAASSLQRPFNSASWTGPSNSGPLHHDRRISTARSSAPIVPIGRNSGTQSIHGLQTSRGSWPSGSITGTGIGPIRRWAAFHPSTGSANESDKTPLSGNRRGCIRPHTRAHQDRRLSPRQSSR